MPMLTTTQQVKDFLVGIGEEIPEGHEALLEFLIRDVSEQVENFCRRRFGRQTYIEEHTGQRHQKLLTLYHWPIVSVSTVTIRENGVTSEITAGTLDHQYQIKKNAWGEQVALYREDGWFSDAYGVKVTYEAGFVLPGIDVTNRDLPYALERAVVELVALAYQHRGRSGVARESFEGLSLDLDRWPMHVKQALWKFQRPRV